MDNKEKVLTKKALGNSSKVTNSKVAYKLHSKSTAVD